MTRQFQIDWVKLAFLGEVETAIRLGLCLLTWGFPQATALGGLLFFLTQQTPTSVQNK